MLKTPILSFLLLVPVLLQAHEGETHTAPQIAAVATPGSNLLALSATTELFEVVVKYPGDAAPGEVPITLFLSEAPTDAPVAGAQLQLQIESAGVDLIAAATPTPGIYQAKLALPTTGPYELLLTVTAGEELDLIPLNGLRLGEKGGAGQQRGWQKWGVGIGAALVVVALVLWGRARRRTALAALLAMAMIPALAQAHEGEAHGEAPPAIGAAQAPGAPLIIPKETQFLLGIRTAPAQRQALTARIRVNGRFSPRATGQAEVAPVAAGRVVIDSAHPLALLGEQVQRGEVLAVLEQLPEAQFALEAAYNTAQGELEQARQEYARHQELRQITSLKEQQQVEARLKVAEAEYARLDNELKLFAVVRRDGRQVHHLYVRAPIAGTVTAANLIVGQQVDPSTWLFRLVGLDTLWVEAEVYETDLPRVEIGRAALVTTKVYPGEQFAGHLVGLSGTIDEVSRTARALFEVANPGQRLKAGMSAQVAIDTSEPIEALTVPEDALVEAGDKHLVYVHTQPEQFVSRQVELGQQEKGWVEVKAGLSPGERVVTVGAYQLWSQGLK